MTEIYRNSCRACMSKDVPLQGIFQTEVNSVPVSAMLTFISSLNIVPNDGLPDTICSTCFNSLLISYEFHQMCVNSDMQMRASLSLLQQVTTETGDGGIDETPKPSSSNVIEATEQPRSYDRNAEEERDHQKEEDLKDIESEETLILKAELFDDDEHDGEDESISGMQVDQTIKEEEVSSDDESISKPDEEKKKNTSRRMDDRRRSKAWQFFTDLNNNKAKCNVCGRIMSYKGGGPYNLIRHTKSLHPTIFDAIRQTDDVNEVRTLRSTSNEILPPDKTIANVNQPPVNIIPPATSTQATSSTAPRSIKMSQYLHKQLSAQKAEQLNRYLIELLAKNFLPFNLVEAKEFKKFITELNPNFQIPSRKTLSNALLTNYFNLTKVNVQNLLEQASHIAITTDGWTSKSNENYVSLTAHFLNEKTELQSCMLECSQYSNRNNADNLTRELKRMCDDWNISDRIVAETSDNANKIKATIKLNNWPHIPCFAHTLDFVVQRALQEIEITHLKIKSIVEVFRRNPLATERLKSMQKKLGEHELKLKQDVMACWNSTYEMFERVLKAQNSLIATMAIDYKEINNINSEDIDILTNATELLAYFKDVTDEMSSEKNVTISEIMLITNALKKQCRCFLKNDACPLSVKNMAQCLLDELSTRFANMEDNEFAAQSTLLDPRFKRHGFINEFAFNRACTDLKTLVSNVHIQHQGMIKEILHQPPPPKKSRSIWNEFDEDVSDLIKNANPTAEGIIEMDKYLQEPLLPRTMDPLKWWHEKKDSYPRLFEIVKKRMCIAATSVPSERVFSKSGQILVERRNLLSGKKVSQLMFLNYNM